ncbi:MAG: shikimate kinase AroL [Planctomycetes bacterium]|nr:shikimate kinase AroL [Planctomycetota bacterium]
MATQSIIYIIGARASGKSTLGPRLARHLGRDFVDTDRHMLETGGQTVEEVVAAEGWEGFRRREAEALRQVSRPGRVVATGGGIILSPDNRRFMRERGTVIYLAAPAAVLAARLAANPGAAGRPSLTGLSIAEEMAAILEQRSPLYHETAHHVVDAARDREEVLQTLRQVCAALPGAGGSQA